MRTSAAEQGALARSQHLTGELLLRAAGDSRVNHVPYRGGRPLLQDLFGGVIDAGVVTFSAGAQQARAGQLIALAVTSADLAPTFPDVPTAAQRIAPGLVQTTWMGLFVPKGTPDAIQMRIHTAAASALKEPAIIDRLRSLGFEPPGQDAAALPKLFGSTTITFRNIATERAIVSTDG